MHKQKFLQSLIIIFVFWGQAHAQLSKDAIPFSFKNQLPSVKEYVELVSFDVESMKKEDEISEAQGLKPRRFAKMLTVDLSPENSGNWEVTDQGRVWRIGITSKNAYSLYLVFGNFQLSGDAKLFVYTPGYKELRGSFTKRNNNIHNVLAIAPLPSDTLIIELNIPNEQTGYGKLALTKVGHDYRNEFGKKTLKSNSYPTTSGNCYIDINCPDGADWQTEKKAVCKILMGEWLCSGALVANSAGEKIPYFLTANHCFTDSNSIPEALVYFNYELPYCGATSSNPEQALSGASIISTTDFKLDFLLLKLDNLPPASYHPYFAGWDMSNTQPQSGTVIHHPNGSVKKISLDNSPLINGTYSVSEGYNSNSFWEVTHYDVGATEGGSSGAPIFDSHHRLVGTLTGGNPGTCSDPNFDFYTKFALDWDMYPNPENQLKAWLDPGNTGIAALDGFDPYGFSMNNCDTAWHVGAKEMLDVDRPVFSWTNDYNPNAITNIAEKFHTDSWLDIFGVFFNVNKVHFSQQLSTVTVKVWSGDTYPVTEVFSQEVFLKNINPKAVNYVVFDSVVKVSGNFFIGYSVSPSDSFVVYHAQNRGIEGPSTVYVDNGSWQPIDVITSPAMYTSLAIGLTQCYGKIETPKSQSIKIYPNPCQNYLNIQPAEGVALTGVSCFDVAGQSVPISYTLSGDSGLVNFNLRSGIYFLKVMTKSESVVLRFVVVDNLY